jgi:hypothetical protein
MDSRGTIQDVSDAAKLIELAIQLESLRELLAGLRQVALNSVQNAKVHEPSGYATPVVNLTGKEEGLRIKLFGLGVVIVLKSKVCNKAQC